MSNKITQQELVDLYVKNNETYFLHFPEKAEKIICVYVGKGKKVHLSCNNETYCGAGTLFKMSRRPSYKFKVYENEFPTSWVCNKCVSLPKAVAVDMLKPMPRLPLGAGGGGGKDGNA